MPGAPARWGRSLPGWGKPRIPEARRRDKMRVCDEIRAAYRVIPVGVLLLAGLLSGCSGGGTTTTTTTPSGIKIPKGMSAVQADTLLKFYAKDRSETEAWLKSSPT